MIYLNTQLQEDVQLVSKNLWWTEKNG